MAHLMIEIPDELVPLLGNTAEERLRFIQEAVVAHAHARGVPASATSPTKDASKLSPEERLRNFQEAMDKVPQRPGPPADTKRENIYGKETEQDQPFLHGQSDQAHPRFRKLNTMAAEDPIRGVIVDFGESDRNELIYRAGEKRLLLPMDVGRNAQGSWNVVILDSMVSWEAPHQSEQIAPAQRDQIKTDIRAAFALLEEPLEIDDSSG